MSSRSLVGDLFSGYASDYHPLAGYAAIVGTFHAAFAGFLLLTRAQRRPLPGRLHPSDLLLLGIATYKLGRLIARDVVTSFARAPFTRFESWGELPNEVNEQARGRGLQRALGELLICPPCTDTWVAAFLTYGLVLWPRVTRLVASIFTVLTIADFLQVAYLAAHARQEPAQPHEEEAQRVEQVDRAPPAQQEHAAQAA